MRHPPLVADDADGGGESGGLERARDLSHQRRRRAWRATAGVKDTEWTEHAENQEPRRDRDTDIIFLRVSVSPWLILSLCSHESRCSTLSPWRSKTLCWP